MSTISLVTPISYSQIQNLSFTEYILIYLDKNSKLKRAIPDFGEKFIDSDSSLIFEALNADRVSAFRIVRKGIEQYENNPIFCVDINEEGTIINHNNFGENITKLENFLLDSKRRETVSKLLKKTR